MRASGTTAMSTVVVMAATMRLARSLRICMVDKTTNVSNRK
jgi:hypothetical protein